MKGWEEKYFNDFIKLNRGFDLPNSQLIEGEFPVVTSTEINSYHHSYKVKGPGVVTGRSGSLGTVQYVESEFWPHNTTLYVKDFKGNDPKFVYYFLQTMHLENYNSGAGIPSLNQNHLHKQKILIPKISDQKSIAYVLNAYDNLVHVNEERIYLLENSARELYKEWFVRMRFPNYKKTHIVKGIPEDWTVCKLSDLMSTQYGYTASASIESVGPKYLRITDVANNFIDWENVPYCNIPDKEKKKYLLNIGDIVIARTGATVGFAKRINKLHPPTIFASYLVRLKAFNPEFSNYLGIIIESDNYKDYIQSVASGAAQPQANANLMTKFLLFKPTDSLIKKFNLIVEPLLDQIEILQFQNIQLRQIRDRLLPRLISGKLQVKNSFKLPQTISA